MKHNTRITLEGIRAELKLKQLYRVKWCLKAREEVAHLPLEKEGPRGTKAFGD